MGQSTFCRVALLKRVDGVDPVVARLDPVDVELAMQAAAQVAKLGNRRGLVGKSGGTLVGGRRLPQPYDWSSAGGVNEIEIGKRPVRSAPLSMRVRALSPQRDDGARFDGAADTDWWAVTESGVAS